MSEISLISATALKTISDETKSLDLLAESVGESFEQIVEMIHQSEGKIVVTGIGKSGIVAMKIAATLSSTGSPAAFMHGADASHGDMGIIEKKDVVIALSKSGNTKEVKDLIPFIKNNGNVLIGMTANPSSFLGAQSDHILFTPVEKEACPHNLAPTTSTTVQMVLGDALAMCLMELKEFKPKDFAQIHPSGTLGKKLQLKICHLINKSKKPSVSPKDSMRDVIFEISEKRLGATIVEHNDRILGLITDGDIRRVLEHNSSISGISAQHMMTKTPVQINENFLAFEALKMMKSRKINHLVVTGTGNKYLGIVHILDLIKEGLDG